MRRLLLSLAITAVILVPGAERVLLSDIPLAHADPTLSGAKPTEVLNGDFSGVGLGQVGTPPTNHDFETAGGTTGTPPANYGFSSGDFGNWTLTGSPTIQSGGPNGYYAQLGSGQRVKSDAFTVASDAQTLTFNVAAVSTGTFQWKLVIYSGASYATTTTKYFSTCPTTCTNWNSYSLDAMPWQGQSIKVEVQRYLGNLNVDDVAVGQLILSGWAPAAGDKVSYETGGPSGAYAKTTTAVTSQAFTVDSNAQNGEVDLKVDGASGSYTVSVLSGSGYGTSTQVYSGAQADSASWGTKLFGLGDYVGQSVKMKVVPANGTTLLMDKAGVARNLLPGWNSGGSNALVVDDTNGVRSASAGVLTNSQSVTIDTVATGKAWFKVCYNLVANLQPNGTNIGSTIRLWFGSYPNQVWQDGSYSDVYREAYFVLDSTVHGTSGAFQAVLWPTTSGNRLGSISCLERVDPPAGSGGPTPGTGPDVTPRVAAAPGDPVDAASGNFHHTKVDLAVPGKGIPLSFERIYVAQSKSRPGTQTSPLGAHWSHNWESRLTEANTSIVVVTTPGGGRYAFYGVSYTPMDGVQATLVKNGGGDWTLTTVEQLVYAFDSGGKLTSVKDRNNNTTTLAYDGSNRLSTLTDPGGRALTLTYTSDRITSVSDGLGRSVSYAYSSAGDLTTITDVMGGTVSYQYSGHLLTQGTDAKGNVFVRNTYDAQGRVVSQLDAPGTTSTFAYSTPGDGATRYTDGRSKQTTYYFDQQMRITDVKDHDGGVTTFVYDSDNNRTSVTNPLGKTWQYTYDGNGNVLTAKDPLLKQWTYTYNSRNDVVTVTDPLSRVTTFGYDTAGNLSSVTDAASKVTSFTVNSAGLVTAVTDPLSHTTSLGYDSYGNRTSVTNALNKTWTTAYDTKGRPTSVTDPLSHTTSFTYNAANLVLTVTDSLSQVTTYTYDANGNVLTVTDANTKVTTYAYNNRDLVTSVTDPASQVWSFAYDATANLTSKTNPRGKTTTYTYDNLSRLSTETDPLSFVRSYSYDAGSRLTSRTDPKSQALSYTYNDRNELTNITYPDTSYVSFAYNDAGAQTQMVDATGTTTYSYDSLYRLTGVTFPGSRTVSYGYDDASRETSITYPGGTNQVTYAYDNANRLTTVTDWNSRAVAYAYDDAGRMTTATLPSSTNIVSSFAYDNADRLTSVSHVKNGNTTVASASYTLDAVGNRTQRVDQQGTHTYAYDNAYRLTSVTYPGPATTSYAFDAFGNRTSKTEPGSQTTTYAYNDGDRLASVTPPGQSAISYTWDNNGDLTARGSDSFSWDYEDRMTSATVGGTTTTFAYRGDGLRHSKTTGGNTTTFTWDVNAGLPVVLDDGNQYVYGAGLESMVTAGGTYYYLADGLGSTMAMVDTSGTVQKSYTYDVYGKATATGSLANEFDFAGQETDGSTGLQYLRARYYDVETGTFVSREPMAVLPAWSRNPYGYVGANPASYIDPTGLDKCGWTDPWECVRPAVQFQVLVICLPASWLVGSCNPFVNAAKLGCKVLGCTVSVVFVRAGMEFGEYKLSQHAAEKMEQLQISPDKVRRAMASKSKSYRNKEGNCVEGFFDSRSGVFVSADPTTGLITTVIDEFSKTDFGKLRGC